MHFHNPAKSMLLSLPHHTGDAYMLKCVQVNFYSRFSIRLFPLLPLNLLLGPTVVCSPEKGKLSATCTHVQSLPKWPVIYNSIFIHGGVVNFLDYVF